MDNSAFQRKAEAEELGGRYIALPCQPQYWFRSIVDPVSPCPLGALL
jgi:hypothetical protein